MSMKLYVGNLSFQTSSSDLQDLFSQAGTVESASVVEDRDTGRSRGFGFVEMSSKEEGEAAIARFNGNDLNGRNLTVNVAKPRESRNGGRTPPSPARRDSRRPVRRKLNRHLKQGAPPANTVAGGALGFPASKARRAVA